MDTKKFKSIIRGLKAIPQELQEKFLALAGSLSEIDGKVVLGQLALLNAELAKNEQTYASSVKRGRAMVDQIAQHDFPALDA